MRDLTKHGTAALSDIARRHAVGTDAARTVLEALVRGGGAQAQFSHPDLGGMGQWSRGGMLMIGDMFNADLKARVAHLCADLSNLLDDKDVFEATGGSGDTSGDWWPEACGRPAARGSQNAMRYAYFPETRRLAVDRGGEVSVYDTGSHQITGVSQQQSGTQDLTFTSQHGTVRLHELTPLDGAKDHAAEPSAAAPAAGDAAPGADDVFATLERLHALQQKGILSDAEFAEKKKELLGRV